MRDPDVIDLLASLGDAGLHKPSGDAGSETAHKMLLVEIEREAKRHRRRPRRGRRLALVVATVAGLFGAVSGGYAALSLSDGPELASSGVACHLDDSLDGSLAAKGLDGGRAISTCAAIWRKGDLKPGTTRVPPLTACVAPGKPIHVFPGADPGVCSRYSMVADQGAGTDPNATRFVSFARDVRDSFLSAPSCVAEPEARKLVRGALARHSFSDWTIEAPGSAGRTGACMSPAFDSDARVVYLLPEGPGS